MEMNNLEFKNYDFKIISYVILISWEEISMTIQKPYVLFLGDAPDPLAAKVPQGIKDWRPGYSVGQIA